MRINLLRLASHLISTMSSNPIYTNLPRVVKGLANMGIIDLATLKSKNKEYQSYFEPS